jgi:N,N-dimethylformamidase
VPITVPGQGGTESPKVRADMVFFETPNGGAVFSVGSINWLSSLAWNQFDNNVARVTENVLRRFADSRPFAIP